MAHEEAHNKHINKYNTAYEEAHKEHINKYKMAHCIGVAEYMRENAPKYGLDADAMYVVGLLHDIGYLNGRRGHEQAGEEILKKIGINEDTLFAVANHGKNLYEVEAEFQANGGANLLAQCPELVLMCEADMSINARGYRVGFDKRLEDIANRYGNDGIEYATASATVNFVKEQLEKLSPHIEIYQLTNSSENHNYTFASLKSLAKKNAQVDDNRYDYIYCKAITASDLCDRNSLLENTYKDFNIDCPADFKGYALSVADVMVICDGKTREAYYVDSSGFSKLESGKFSRLPDYSHTIPYGKETADKERTHEKKNHFIERD